MQPLRVVVVAFVLALVASRASAHEIGKTQVTIVVRDAAYAIDVVVDPDALLTKLEVFGGTPVSAAALSRSERDRRIAALSTVFLDRAVVRFDGRVDRPRFA